MDETMNEPIDDMFENSAAVKKYVCRLEANIFDNWMAQLSLNKWSKDSLYSL